MSATERFNLTGKIAFVTGASRGLGREFALTLAGAGADVAITSRQLDALESTRIAIEKQGRRCLPVALDVRDRASIEATATAVESGLGPIDILVNNAGCNVRKPALEVT